MTSRKHGKKGVLGQLRTHKYEASFVVFLLTALGLGLFFIHILKDNLGLDEQEVYFGATFSKSYAEELDLKWKDLYVEVLDDLGVRRLRLPVYWTDLEEVRGKYDFSVIDWQVEEAAKRDAKVILAIGRKLPRWPECHTPIWTDHITEDEVREDIVKMLEAVVIHFEDNPTVIAWQVENEPLFRFGECPPPDIDFLQREVAVVRALDERPVMITESGELSTWIRAAGVADVLGISTYRTVWTKYIGYFYWPIGPSYYAKRANVIAPLVDKIIVSELQAEPWSQGPIANFTLTTQLQLMNEDELAENVSFARKIGFSEAYVWGVEWWYWVKERGYPEIWEAGQRLFDSNNEASDNLLK